jgi:hypothetical protein
MHRKNNVLMKKSVKIDELLELLKLLDKHMPLYERYIKTSKIILNCSKAVKF